MKAKAAAPRRLHAMTYFNPLVAPLAQGQQVQRSAAEKERQVARAQALSKNTAAEGDRFDHQVESTDALTAVGDQPSNGGQTRQQQRRSPSAPEQGAADAAQEPSHIDVTG